MRRGFATIQFLRVRRISGFEEESLEVGNLKEEEEEGKCGIMDLI